MISRHSFALQAVLAAFLTAPAAVVIAQDPQPDATMETCLDKARSKAAKDFENKGLTREAARLQLETAAAFCLEPGIESQTAAFLGRVRTDLARYARDFALGSLSPAAYKAARADRTRKLGAFRDDLQFHKALVKGDGDRDLIPDSRDRCPGTPDATATDDSGCPTTPTTVPPEGDPERFRRLVDGAVILRNKSCDGAPPPLTPQPVKWGRSESVEGIKLLVTQVAGMPQGCELFYELRLHFQDPADPAIPPELDVSLVFRESEDLDPNTTLAAFGLPQANPVSPGRARAIQAFLFEYPRVTWKVRSVNGNNLTSSWSAPITQTAAPGGLP